MGITTGTGAQMAPPSLEQVAEGDLSAMLSSMDDMRGRLEEERAELNRRTAHIETLLGMLRRIQSALQEKDLDPMQDGNLGALGPPRTHYADPGANQQVRQP